MISNSALQGITIAITTLLETIAIATTRPICCKLPFCHFIFSFPKLLFGILHLDSRNHVRTSTIPYLGGDNPLLTGLPNPPNFSKIWLPFPFNTFFSPSSSHWYSQCLAHTAMAVQFHSNANCLNNHSCLIIPFTTKSTWMGCILFHKPNTKIVQTGAQRMDSSAISSEFCINEKNRRTRVVIPFKRLRCPLLWCKI